MIDSRLPLSLLAAVVAYWLSTLAMETSYVSIAAALFQFSAGLVVCGRYMHDTYEVVIRGARDPDQPGSHLAILGIWLMGFGAIYSGGFGAIINANVISGEWIGTATSGFGRYIMAIGFSMLVYSPDAARRGFVLKPGLWLLVTALAVAAFFSASMFMLGVQVGKRDGNSPFEGAIYRKDPTRPVCLEDEKVWVSKQGRYHTEASPWRFTFSPVACFRTEDEARAAGYRAPG